MWLMMVERIPAVCNALPPSRLRIFLTSEVDRPNSNRNTKSTAKVEKAAPSTSSIMVCKLQAAADQKELWDNTPPVVRSIWISKCLHMILFGFSFLTFGIVLTLFSLFTASLSFFLLSQNWRGSEFLWTIQQLLGVSAGSLLVIRFLCAWLGQYLLRAGLLAACTQLSFQVMPWLAAAILAGIMACPFRIPPYLCGKTLCLFWH